MEDDNSPLPCIIFVIGPPASGRQTICRRLAQEYNLGHFSGDDWIRHMPLSDATALIAANAQGLPDSVVLPRILTPWLQLVNRMADCRAILVSGLTVDSWTHLMRLNEERNFPTLVVALRCSLDTALRRYMARSQNHSHHVNDSVAAFSADYADYMGRELGDYFTMRIAQLWSEGDTPADQERQCAELLQLIITGVPHLARLIVPRT